jgi:hypothetical protein
MVDAAELITAFTEYLLEFLPSAFCLLPSQERVPTNYFISTRKCSQSATL